MGQEYVIQLEGFEGPMDLLLHLIERNKIDIYDIPIALLTEQYLAYLDKFKEFNIDIASEFLVMAATLLQIKSRILLPHSRASEEGEAQEDTIDPRQELVERLLEYKKFKQASILLQEMKEVAQMRFFRESTPAKPKYIPPTNMDVQLLYQAFVRLVHQRDLGEELETVNVRTEQYRVEDKINWILELLQNKSTNYCFSDLINPTTSKQELITLFLALLELIKSKQIHIFQTANFSPIYFQLASNHEY